MKASISLTCAAASVGSKGATKRRATYSATIMRLTPAIAAIKEFLELSFLTALLHNQSEKSLKLLPHNHFPEETLDQENWLQKILCSSRRATLDL